MPLFTSQNFTGATSYPNALAGTGVDFLPVAATLSVYAVADKGTAGDIDTMEMRVYAGTNPMLPVPAGYVIPAPRTAGSGPDIPDNVIVSQLPIPAASRIVMNLTAAAATDAIRVKTYVQP